MDVSNLPLLSLLILLPAASAAVVFLLPLGEALSKTLALLVGVANLALAVVLFRSFDPASADLQLVEKVNWIPELGASYHVGVDGLSLFMVMITSFMVLMAMLCSWDQGGRRQDLFYGFLLLLQSGLIGIFLALDLLLFYVFWEVMLIPMYFLVGVWGGENRRYATLKFIIYTMGASLLMLVAILALYFCHHTQAGE
ncbi:MAG: complex I subunit 4 family protein, partial [Planctomycetota bacterium]